MALRSENPVRAGLVSTADDWPYGGEIGPITRRLSETYFDAVRGRLPAYRHWLTPVY